MGERNQQRSGFVTRGTKADKVTTQLTREMATGKEKVDRVGMWDPRINRTVVSCMAGQICYKIRLRVSDWISIQRAPPPVLAHLPELGLAPGQQSVSWKLGMLRNY
jgi:hypothetical protein